MWWLHMRPEWMDFLYVMCPFVRSAYNPQPSPSGNHKRWPLHIFHSPKPILNEITKLQQTLFHLKRAFVLEILSFGSNSFSARNFFQKKKRAVEWMGLSTVYTSKLSVVTDVSEGDGDSEDITYEYELLSNMEYKMRKNAWKMCYIEELFIGTSSGGVRLQ